MAVQNCPLFDSPFYSYTMDLSRDTYTLTFRYSSRSEGYLMDIFDAEENPVVRNIKLVPLTALLDQYSLSTPEGDFVVLPNENTDLSESSVVNPRRIFETHSLYYIDP